MSGWSDFQGEEEAVRQWVQAHPETGYGFQVRSDDGEWSDLPMTVTNLRPTMPAFEHDEREVVVSTRPSWSTKLGVRFERGRVLPPFGFGDLIAFTENPHGWAVHHPRFGSLWLSEETLVITAREATR